MLSRNSLYICTETLLLYGLMSCEKLKQSKVIEENPQYFIFAYYW